MSSLFFSLGGICQVNEYYLILVKMGSCSLFQVWVEWVIHVRYVSYDWGAGSYDRVGLGKGAGWVRFG